MVDIPRAPLQCMKPVFSNAFDIINFQQKSDDVARFENLPTLDFLANFSIIL